MVAVVAIIFSEIENALDWEFILQNKVDDIGSVFFWHSDSVWHKTCLHIA